MPVSDSGPSDYLFGLFRSSVGAEGFFEEDGEIYSESGLMVAQSRQLALLR
jgi:hypothetical protein